MVLLWFPCNDLSPKGSIVIETYDHRLSPSYIAYYKKDAETFGFICNTGESSNSQVLNEKQEKKAQISIGATYQQYSIAVSMTYDFSSIYLNLYNYPLNRTSFDSLRAIADGIYSILNEVNLTYRKEIGVELIAPDPINKRADFISCILHETGHAFGARHTFNGAGCSPSQVNNQTNAEPGSGSTIMSYGVPVTAATSICGSDNLFIPSDNDLDYFHNLSFEQITNTVNNNHTCGYSIPNYNPRYPLFTHINQAPQVSIPSDIRILPIYTAFTLRGSATDADGDPLTAAWEEVDVGGDAHPLSHPYSNGSYPAKYDPNASLFRSFPPAIPVQVNNQTSVFERTFPKWYNSQVFTLNFAKGEFLPTYQRDLQFKLTVRDQVGGVTSSSIVTLTVDPTLGPFLVGPPQVFTRIALRQRSSPNIKAGDTLVVNYNMGGSNTAYNHLVVVELSTDGGTSFPHQLKSPDNTVDTFLNYRGEDSSKAKVKIPEGIATDSLVLRVKAVDGSYFAVFDISNSVYVSAKALLGGVYDSNTSLMTDNLRVDSLLPIFNPYDELGFAKASDMALETPIEWVFDFTGKRALTDWVWLELRSSTDSTQILSTRSALIRRDGNIVDMDGASPVGFSNVRPGNYYIALRHRNHLGVMTAAPLALNSITSTLVDFTSPSTATWGNNAERNLNGVMVMWAGDVNGDGVIKYNGANNDKNALLSKVGLTNPNDVLSLYDREDVNLHGKVRYNGAANDKNAILNSVGLTTPNNVIIEQIPHR
jgi:hypothetical protein